MTTEFFAQLHPKLVHFPIALFMIYFLFETLGALLKKEWLSNAAMILLTLAILSSFASLLTGNLAEKVGSDLDVNVRIWSKLTEAHESWANITTWYFAVVFAARLLYLVNIQIKKKFTNLLHTARYGFVVLGLVGCYFVFRTGHAGGEIVYESNLIQAMQDRVKEKAEEAKSKQEQGTKSGSDSKESKASDKDEK